MAHVMTPRGDFSLRTANEYFGGWIGAHTGSDGLVVPMAFPVVATDVSAAVLVRQNSDGGIVGEVYGAGDAKDRAWRQALAALSLDEDGSGFAAVGERDPVIGELQVRYEGLRPVLFHSPFEAAAAFCIGHRISVAQSRAIRQRMASELGAAIDTPAGVQYAFPTPEALLRVDSFPGIPAAKWPRLHAIARATLDGLIDRARLRSLPVDQALAELRTVPGLGPFFSQGVLFRGAGLVDAVSDDEVTKQAVQGAYHLDRLPDHAEVLHVAEAWRPYRMWASVLLHVWLRREGGGPRKDTRGRR